MVLHNLVMPRLRSVRRILTREPFPVFRMLSGGPNLYCPHSKAVLGSLGEIGGVLGTGCNICRSRFSSLDMKNKDHFQKSGRTIQLQSGATPNNRQPLSCCGNIYLPGSADLCPSLCSTKVYAFNSITTSNGARSRELSSSHLQETNTEPIRTKHYSIIAKRASSLMHQQLPYRTTLTRSLHVSPPGDNAAKTQPGLNINVALLNLSEHKDTAELRELRRFQFKGKSLQDMMSLTEADWEAMVDLMKLSPDDIKIYEAHKAAVAAGERFYEDPKTGYIVMTRMAHLKRGTCCGNSCRHCPFGHVAVNPALREKFTFNSAFFV